MLEVKCSPYPLAGSNRKRDYRNVRMKKPDYKVAYVQLVSGLRAESQVMGVTYHDRDLGAGDVFVQQPPPGAPRGPERQDSQGRGAGQSLCFILIPCGAPG